MYRKALCLVLTWMMLLTFGACAGPEKEAPSEPSGPVSEPSPPDDSRQEPMPPVNTDQTALSYLTDHRESVTASSSSMTSPLAMEEWGSAAKYCTKDHNYVNVPVRILSVRRGSEVQKELETLQKSHPFAMPELNEQEEYAAAEYEICLNGFPVDKGGTLCDITAFLSGTDGKPVKNTDGSYFSTFAVCPDTEHYYFEGIVHSMLFFKTRKEQKEYLLSLGEYGETQAYVKMTL